MVPPFHQPEALQYGPLASLALVVLYVLISFARRIRRRRERDTDRQG